MLSGPATFYVMKEFGYIGITRGFFFFFCFILPSESQVIISGSKKQQQNDSYQSEVPFSVIPGRRSEMGEGACRTYQGSKSAIWYLLRCLFSGLPET